MAYAKGDRVEHPGKPEWGVGQVLEDSPSTTGRVFFVGAGEKQLSLAHVTLTLVSGDEAKHPILDNPTLASLAKGQKYWSLPQAVTTFLERFPQRFYGDKFMWCIAPHE